MRQPSITLAHREPGNLPRNPLKMAIDLLNVEQDALRTYKVQPQVVRLPTPTLVPEVVVRLKVTWVPPPLVSRRQESFTRKHVPRANVLPVFAILFNALVVPEHIFARKQESFNTQRVLWWGEVLSLRQSLNVPTVLRHPWKRQEVLFRTWHTLVVRLPRGHVDKQPRVMTLVPLQPPSTVQTLVTQQGISVPHPGPLRRGRKFPNVLLQCPRAQCTQETQQV